MDDDNIRGCYKWIRDQLSEMIVDSYDGPWNPPHLTAKRPKGRCDSDPRIKWGYAQETKSNEGTRIDVFSFDSKA